MLNVVNSASAPAPAPAPAPVYETHYRTGVCSHSNCSVCGVITRKGEGVISVCSDKCWNEYKNQFRQWGLDPEYTHFWLRGELWGHERDIAKNSNGELCVVAWIPIKRDRVLITLEEMKNATQTEKH